MKTFVPALPRPRKHTLARTVQRAQRQYSALHLALIVPAFCTVGWVWEVVLDVFQRGQLVNRGMLYGPWLPIYGVVGLALVLLLRPLLHRPLAAAGVTLVSTAVIEYAASWIIEAATGLRWWDYSPYAFNLDGRICLSVLVFFCIGGLLGVYVLAPWLDDQLQKLPRAVKQNQCLFLWLVLAIDILYSMFYPNVHAL